MSLFTYGTLMFAETWQRIGVGEFQSQPATLQGFVVYRLRDAVIPGMVRAEDDNLVTGVIYHGLDEETLFELDAYESELYERIAVQATVAGSSVECQAYVIPESRHKVLTNELWNAAWFEQHELTKYLLG